MNSNYKVQKIPYKIAKEYIIKYHYSHGCMGAANPCYGLFETRNDGLFGEEDHLIGVCMFATPCSEAVRESVFGKEYKEWVIELHRLHILDITPKNTETWFLSRCFKLLKQDKPQIRAIISFSDTTEGHEGIIYQAMSFYYCGKTGNAIFYRDKNNRLHHPRQDGINISKEQAKEMGWSPIKRKSKNRYIYLLSHSKKERKLLFKLCKYTLNTTHELKEG